MQVVSRVFVGLWISGGTLRLTRQFTDTETSGDPWHGDPDPLARQTESLTNRWL